VLGSANHAAFLQDFSQHLTPRIHDWGRGSTERGPDRGLPLARRLHICRGRDVLARSEPERDPQSHQAAMLRVRSKKVPDFNVACIVTANFRPRQQLHA
jgi:hypothetical protein